MIEVWAKWQGQVINGFPLRRLLSGGDHGAVFLTENQAQNLANAALKLVPAIPALAEVQLSRWKTAAALSHPHLIRIFEAGRCRLEDRQFLFVVMEGAEQTLSQILPRRALTPDEVREMLVPTLGALAYLHRRNLSLGRLKPSNILVVEDQLKLASDTIRPAGEPSTVIAASSLYDAPEAKDGGLSTAGDIWGLGMTLVEALTQHPPSWPDGESGTALFSAALPPALVEIVRQCLDRNPANRPTAAQLEHEINPTPRMPANHWRVPAMVVLLITAIAVWAGLRVLSSRTALQQAAPAAGAAQIPELPHSAPPVAPPSANGLPIVLHEEIPDVSPSARNTIRGRVKVAVRVTVDTAGNVVHESLESPGSSRYFVRLATEAARKWKFAPADGQDSREWLLRFEFTRGGVTGHATSASSQ